MGQRTRGYGGRKRREPREGETLEGTGTADGDGCAGRRGSTAGASREQGGLPTTRLWDVRAIG
jgi:hypothetical protein